MTSSPEHRYRSGDHYNSIKRRPDTFFACTSSDPVEIFDTYYALIFDLSQVSVPVGVAITMHAYVLAAVATYPLERSHPYALLRQHLLHRLRKESALLANARLYDDGDGAEHARVTHTATGEYVLSGAARFMSLATVASYALVQALHPQHDAKVLCLVPLARGGFEPGDLVFPGSMAASDTRSVRFRSCPIEGNYLLTAGNDEQTVATQFQQAWFQALIPAAYLGGLQLLLDRLDIAESHSEHARERTRRGGDWRRAAGRARLNMKAAKTLCLAARDALAAFVRAPAGGIQPAYHAASLAKVIGVELIEASIDTIRKAVGAAQISDAVFQRVMAEMQYARLHPAPESAVEGLFFGAK